MYVRVSILYVRLHTQFQLELVNFKHLPRKLEYLLAHPSWPQLQGKLLELIATSLVGNLSNVRVFLAID